MAAHRRQISPTDPGMMRDSSILFRQFCELYSRACNKTGDLEDFEQLRRNPLLLPEPRCCPHAQISLGINRMCVGPSVVLERDAFKERFKGKVSASDFLQKFNCFFYSLIENKE